MYVCMYVCISVSARASESVRAYPWFRRGTYGALCCFIFFFGESISMSSAEGSADSAAQRRVAEDQAARFQQNRFEWFRRRAVANLCELAMERQFNISGITGRQLVARMSIFRRRFEGRTAEQLVELTLPQLAQPAANQLHDDATTLLLKVDTPVPPNDREWILSDQVGRVQDPQRHHVDQFHPPLTAQVSVSQLRTPDAAMVLERLMCNAGGCLYRDCILLFWRLLSEDDRLQLSAVVPGAMHRPTDRSDLDISGAASTIGASQRLKGLVSRIAPASIKRRAAPVPMPGA